MMTPNSVARFLQDKKEPMTLMGIYERMGDDALQYGRMGASEVAIAAALWLGEVEGVIERAGLDANGRMTWMAK